MLVPRLLERFCKAQVNGQALQKLVHKVAPEGVRTATELQHTSKSRHWGEGSTQPSEKAGSGCPVPGETKSPEESDKNRQSVL